MSLSVQLMINKSPNEKLDKDLVPGDNFSCLLKDSTSILKPVLDIKTGANITGWNYMYISDFGRYYFIDDIISLHNDMWRVSGHIDVLQTYKDKILSNSAIIEGSELKSVNNYLNDEVFKVTCKHKTDIVNFPSGLLDSGQFILITAGG